MKLIDLEPSLANLPDYGSGVSNRAIELTKRSLSELTPGDLAFCLRQSMVVRHIAPLALALVSQSPLLEAEHYPGDLLLSLVHAGQKGFLSEQELRELRDACSGAIASAETIALEVVPSAMAFIAAHNDA